MCVWSVNAWFIFFIATPSAPTFLNCTKITNDSLTLQWSEPADNGGEEELQYNITRSIGNSITHQIIHIALVSELGTQLDLDQQLQLIALLRKIVVSVSVYFNISIMQNYSFITCLGLPPMFDSVMVCLGVSDVSPDCLAELIVIYSVSWLVITVVEHNKSLLFIVWAGSYLLCNN